ncbi:MAG: hypothetical protein V4574_02030 [Pseudomonadota bacterium]
MRWFWQADGPAERLIDFCARRGPDDWYVIAGMGSGTPESSRVMMWIVDQPQCSRATAARIFWHGSPSAHTDAVARGERPDDAMWPVIEALLTKWRAEAFTCDGLGWTPDREAPTRYRRHIGRRHGKVDPLDLPPGLFEPIPGRAPLPSAEVAEYRPIVKFLAFDIGSIPGGMRVCDHKAWHAGLQRRRAFQQAAVFCAIGVALSVAIIPQL